MVLCVWIKRVGFQFPKVMHCLRDICVTVLQCPLGTWGNGARVERCGRKVKEMQIWELFSEWWCCVAWYLSKMPLSKDTRWVSDECPWFRGWRKLFWSSHAGRQQLRASWNSQPVLKPLPGSAHQTRKGKMFSSSLRGQGWDHCWAMWKMTQSHGRGLQKSPQSILALRGM